MKSETIYRFLIIKMLIFTGIIFLIPSVFLFFGKIGGFGKLLLFLSAFIYWFFIGLLNVSMVILLYNIVLVLKHKYFKIIYFGVESIVSSILYSHILIKYTFFSKYLIGLVFSYNLIYLFISKNIFNEIFQSDFYNSRTTYLIITILFFLAGFFIEFVFFKSYGYYLILYFWAESMKTLLTAFEI